MMENSKKFNRIVSWLRAHLEVVILFVFVFVAANAVSLEERYLAGAEWRNIPPEIYGDTLTYFAMMQEIKDGDFFVGNPYIFEHRGGISAMASFSVMLAATPLFFGFSMRSTEIINENLWIGIFVFLFFYLLRIMGFRRYAVLSTMFVTLGLYSGLTRPVAMQIVFPFYLLFLIALFLWIKENTVKRKYLLTGAIALTPYVYTYLFQTVVFTMFVVFCGYAIIRNKKRCIELLQIALVSVVLIVPYLLYAHLLLSHEFYQEMMYRYGMVRGHLLSPEAYWYGRWIVIGFLSLAISRFAWREAVSREQFLLFFFSGAGILLGLVSPLFTGFELQTATHVGRFSVFWIFFFLSCIVPALVFSPFERKHFSSFKNIFLYIGNVLLIFMLLAEAGAHLYLRATPFFGMRKDEIVESQHFAGTLSWLRSLPPHQVIFAPEKLNTYLPALTSHYTFYNHYADYTFISDSELNERFWMMHAFDPMDMKTFQAGWDEIHGRNNPPAEAERDAEFMSSACRKLFLPADLCPKPAPILWIEDHKTPEEVAVWFKKDIFPILPQKFREYHVSYVIFPHGAKLPMKSILGETQVAYSDEYFDVYKILY